MKADDLRPRSHAVLERIVLFDFVLTCQTGLHIGAGKSADFAGSDLPVLRDASGRPFIPGSSLRGVLRAGIESFYLSLGLDAVRKEKSESEDLPAGIPEDFAKGWQELDLVDRLFGVVSDSRAEKKKTISYGSRFQISDARCEGDTLFEVRDGVGIQRETRTAATSIKFDVEVVPAGTKFRGRIRLKNPADYEVGLIAQALWMLSEGVLLLGGKSSRGLGWVKVSVTQPRELKAAALLARKRDESEQELGLVEDKFQQYLDSLQELADAAAAVS